jgi:hypothetical protein
MRFFFLSILFFHFILRFFLLVGQVIFGLAKLIGSCQDNSHTIYLFIFFHIFSSFKHCTYSFLSYVHMLQRMIVYVLTF